MRKALLQERNGKNDSYAQHSICNIVDLPIQVEFKFFTSEKRDR